MSERERIAEIAASHHVGMSPVGGRYDVCHHCARMWPCETAQVAVRLAELEAAARACLDEVRGAMAYCPATDALASLVAGEGEQG